MKKLTLVFLAALAASCPLHAAENRNNQPQSSMQIGPGMLISVPPHKGVDTRILPIPAFFYQQGPFSIVGTQAAWALYHQDGATIAVIANLRSEGYDDSDSSYLAGMSNRRMTLEGGLAAAQDFDWGRLTTEWTSDVLNEHGGHEFRVTASRRFNDFGGIEKLAFTPMVGGNWRSKHLNDYYYGVRSSEATAARPAYNAGDTIGLLTGVRMNYVLTEKWHLFSTFSVEWLQPEITNSPIVDRHYRMSMLIGAMYVF